MWKGAPKAAAFQSNGLLAPLNWQPFRVQMPPGVKFPTANADEISSSGVIAGHSVAADGTAQVALAVPVMLTNLADPYRGTASNPGHNNLDTPISFKQSDNDTNIQCVAWIAAHDPNNGNAPRMPQLQAKLPGLSGCTVCWKLQVTFHDRNTNPHRDFDTSDPNDANTSPYLLTDPYYSPSSYTADTPDQVTIPAINNSQGQQNAAGWHQITDGTPWNIYQDPAWPTAVGQRFFGGDAVLSLKVLRCHRA